MRRIAVLVFLLASCVALMACGSSSPARAESLDTSALSRRGSVHARIVAAALAQRSVHWTEYQNMCYVRWTADVTADSGSERITIGSPGCDVVGAKGKGHVQMVLANDVVYVRGDALGLASEYTIYLPWAAAKRCAWRWLAIPKGETLYAQAADGLTLASIAHDVDPQRSGDEPKLSVRRTVSRGTKLIVLRAGSHMGWIGTLSALAQGDPLPVSMSASGCVGCGYSGQFSKWNEPVHVHAPARSTPIEFVCGRCSYPWPLHG